jgi:hypothetical protein
MHEFLNLVHNRFKHSAPPSIWAKIEETDKPNTYLVSCKEYPNTVTVTTGLQSATVDGIRFGMLWYEDGLLHLLNRMKHTQDEIDAQSIRLKELAAAKAARMKK